MAEMIDESDAGSYTRRGRAHSPNATTDER